MKAPSGYALLRPIPFRSKKASKLSPQIRDILSSFPQVTTVANELGRPDDGTGPDGYYNNEFYVGLKPYSDKTWSGETNTQAQTDRGSARKSCMRFQA